MDNRRTKKPCYRNKHIISPTINYVINGVINSVNYYVINNIINCVIDNVTNYVNTNIINCVIYSASDFVVNGVFDKVIGVISIVLNY